MKVSWLFKKDAVFFNDTEQREGYHVMYMCEEVYCNSHIRINDHQSFEER